MRESRLIHGFSIGKKAVFYYPSSPFHQKSIGSKTGYYGFDSLNVTNSDYSQTIKN